MLSFSWRARNPPAGTVPAHVLIRTYLGGGSDSEERPGKKSLPPKFADTLPSCRSRTEQGWGEAKAARVCPTGEQALLFGQHRPIELPSRLHDFPLSVPHIQREQALHPS